MKLTIDVDEDFVSKLVKQDLREIFDGLCKDLKAIKKQKRGWVFSTDYETDVREVERHIEALKIVVEYYGA